MEKVILVDEHDNEIGTMEKMEAHEKGLLHRAFSVFIFNDKNEMLLQQRAFTKYHSGGLWTNACCSHPRQQETTLAAANRRLQEELGFTTPLTKVFDFTYNAPFDNGLTEHEFDHVFVGYYNNEPIINKEEVEAFAYKSLDSITQEIATNKHNYTAWFLIAFPKVYEWFKQHEA